MDSAYSFLCDDQPANKDLSLQHLLPAQNTQLHKNPFHNQEEKERERKKKNAAQILKHIQTQLEFRPRDGLALTYP